MIPSRTAASPHHRMSEKSTILLSGCQMIFICMQFSFTWRSVVASPNLTADFPPDDDGKLQHREDFFILFLRKNEKSAYSDQYNKIAKIP